MIGKIMESVIRNFIVCNVSLYYMSHMITHHMCITNGTEALDKAETVPGLSL